MIPKNWNTFEDFEWWILPDIEITESILQPPQIMTLLPVLSIRNEGLML